MVKSTCPGVSMMLISRSWPSAISWCTAVFFARIVMPFSRSRSIESMTRLFTSDPSRNAPDCHSIASTSVVLPWSTCATIATLRRSERMGMKVPRVLVGGIARRVYFLRSDAPDALPATSQVRAPGVAAPGFPAQRPSGSAAFGLSGTRLSGSRAGPVPGRGAAHVRCGRGSGCVNSRNRWRSRSPATPGSATRSPPRDSASCSCRSGRR